MFEKFTRQDAGDFRQRYQGTYGYFRRGTKKTLVRLDKVDIDNNVVIFVDIDGLTYDIQADASDDSIGFDFLPPKMAYHNTPAGTYLLRRVPQRQFSRGLSERNITIKTLNGQAVEVNFHSLRDVFERPLQILQAFHRALALKTGVRERSFAISPQFGISLDHNALFCFNDHIGNVTVSSEVGIATPSVAVKLQDFTLWGTEIKDALARAEIKGIVT